MNWLLSKPFLFKAGEFDVAHWGLIEADSTYGGQQMAVKGSPSGPTALALYALRMFGVTGGYHRYFAHRSFKTSRLGQFALAVLAVSSGQRGVLWWAWHHRHHHRHSDGPEDRPTPPSDPTSSPDPNYPDSASDGRSGSSGRQNGLAKSSEGRQHRRVCELPPGRGHLPVGA